MLKRICFILFVGILISACSNSTGKSSFLKSIEAIEKTVERGDWQKGKEQAKDLLSLYESNKWKLQFIGDESEYEQLFRSIKRLIAVIEVEAVVEAKIELATIQSIIEDIYSM